MLARLFVRGFLLLCLGSTLIGCDNSGLNSVQVSPASQSLTVGQTAQLKAVGTFGNAKHPSTEDITSSASWSSTVPAVATVSSSGLVTAVGAGTTTITASATAYSGHVSSSAGITVTASSGGTNGGSGGNILSLTIIPSGIVFGSLTQSGQFLAIGTFSAAPTVRDLTNSVKWLTSQPNKYPVTNYSNSATGTGTQNGGVVSAYEASVGNVGAIITAEATDSSGSIAVATANVGCPLILPNPPSTPGSCYQAIPQLLSTLTVYNEGLNPNTPELGGNWLVTAPSATGTAAVLHCGPGSPGAGLGNSVCTATYPLGTAVTLTAPAQTGVKFGGWSSNCLNATLNPTGPNTCTVNLSASDATVGAIFN
jgi:Bacterial Ig-like domain (group 2)/Divergent InlB B-repeat domain